MRRTAILWTFFAWAACQGPPAQMDPRADPDPRVRLGIPQGARTVVIFGQAAHLDVDWQKTFDQYYQDFVGDIFLEARQIMESQPRAFYSVAEMAYLKHHLEVHPEEAPRLARLVKAGALRIVGGGVTSPDTVLPETELLVRDFLYGSLFSEGTLGARAQAAWLPDSFGHAATAPDVLAAAGLSSVGFARIDGAPTFYEALVPARNHVKPGSDAELLQKMGSADFIWRGPGGGSVLGHFLSDNLYCTGDNIDYQEAIQVPGDHLGVFRGDEPDFVDGQIDGYVKALLPYARTPYLFVPVGCDFQHPKEQLIGYLDGYNQRHFAGSGVYAVAGTFADYAALVWEQRERLPELDADLTPYFMGFYGSRAAIKQGTRAATRPFLAAEAFAAALGGTGRALMAAAAPALEKLARADHHDFVTGTSADAVVAGEQVPLLSEAQQAGEGVLGQVAAALAARIPASAGALGRVLVLNPAGVERSETVEITAKIATDAAVHAQVGQMAVPVEVVGSGADGAVLRVAIDRMPPLSWQAIDVLPGPGAVAPANGVAVQLLDAAGQPASGAAVVRVVLQNPRVRAQWDRGPGGFALTSLQIDGAEALAGPSFVVRDYNDQGGLWRLGNEMPGCTLTLVPPGPDGMSEAVEIVDQSALRARVAFRGTGLVREAALDAGGAALDLALSTAAQSGMTRTATFAFAGAGTPLRTGLAGGFAERTPERVYTPTYWPAVGWLSTGPWAILLRQSTGVRFGGGEAELMAARNAATERCDAEGGTGTDPGTHRIEWRIARAGTPAAAEQAAQVFNRPMVVLAEQGGSGGLPAAASLLGVSGEGAISALKPAERGDGLIVRVLLMPGPVTLHLSPLLGAGRLVQTDAVERDLKDLGKAGPDVVLDREHYGAIATLRLLTGP